MLIKPESERFREPVLVAGNKPEQSAGDQHVVKVSDKERCIVQVEIHRNSRVDHTSCTTDDKQ